jgi:SAM-dependent methyltransferase
MEIESATVLEAPGDSVLANTYEKHQSTVPIGDSLDMIASLCAYNQWVYNLVRPHLGQRVLEVGCGTGNLTHYIATDGKDVTGIELVTRFVKAFEDRFADQTFKHTPRVIRGTLADMAVPTEASAYFDSVVSFNVLEHIDDHVLALSDMKDQVHPGGNVIVFAPGSPFAFGELDEALGHYRRYTPASMKQAMEQAGLQWVDGRYSNMLGAGGWWFNSRILKKQDVPGDQAKLFNRLVPMLTIIEKIIKPWFGQSVMGVGKRPA